MSEWREIEGYPDYQVSDDGQVKHGDYVMIGNRIRSGHKQVKLRRNGKTICHYVHRLVAKAFIPNPDNLPIVRHLNDNPIDNNVDNLAWGTQKDNMNDSIRNGSFKYAKNNKLHEARDKAYEKTSKHAVFEKDGEIFEFSSLSEGCRKLKLNISHAAAVARGKRNHTGGYKIYYK